MICKHCSQEKPAHKDRPTMCDECVKAEKNRTNNLRTNHSWIELAKEAELDLWERQPQETDHEYHVWMRYRDTYPGKRPTHRDVAEEVGITEAAVKHVSKRWSFTTRMQAWVKHIDEITLLQRETEIKHMNEQHISMAARLNAKISKAIDLLAVEEITAKDINALMKTATELEKKARIDVMAPNKMFVDDNPELAKNEIKTNDIGEILKILGAAGVLENLGVRQTVTTEVVVKNDD